MLMNLESATRYWLRILIRVEIVMIATNNFHTYYFNLFYDRDFELYAFKQSLPPIFIFPLSVIPFLYRLLLIFFSIYPFPTL